MIFKKYQKYFDYLPLLLITLLFVADAELETKAVNLSCQIVIMITCVSVFFIIALKFRNSKVIAFFIAVAFWLILVHIKNKYIHKNLV